MMTKSKQPSFNDDATLYPAWNLRLRRVQLACGLSGAAATIAHHEMLQRSTQLAALAAAIIFVSLAVPVGTQALRYFWSRARSTFLIENRVDFIISAVWIVGMAFLPALAYLTIANGVTVAMAPAAELGVLLLGWSQLLTLARGIRELYLGIHHAAAMGLNPALVLVVSFASLIAVGTILLMSPRCRPSGELPAPFLKALFTSTSASCVTGLVLEPTSSYWSRTGQVVILCLIQVGGLGIMTFSAFFAFVLGSKLPVREQMTFRELLESERIGDVGGMIRSILVLTFGLELVGAMCLTTLWPELPWSERVFHGVFHAVSSFCNAGFSLRDESFIGWEHKWQVWGLVPLLVILGGFGFNAVDNWRRVLRFRLLERRPFGGQSTAPPRLTLTTRMVTLTTIGLLLGGTLLLYVLEHDNLVHPADEPRQWINAWFHSVTLRTAGFNTIDHEHLRPATKLFSIALMFIGASPGSTGGGIKTVILALTILTLRSVLRGRPAVETGGRTIPEEQVFRGLAILTLGLATLMLSSLLVVMIEDQPARLIDQLYEAASAFGTVGVSANLTPTLKPASQVVIIVTMFFGRVGPLTLIIALAGFRRPRGYAYPEERIALG